MGKEKEARDFYLGILCFQEVQKPDILKKNGGFWCTTNSVMLHIGVEHMMLETSKRHPAFIVQDLSYVKKHLKRHNVQIKEELPIPAINRFSCCDPFQNRIEFLEYVY
ncbi:hypothetical protein [Bacillus weihaiensis]|uniref:hypothetical protein n=1 Tax=Bacillus weihaiensis TaxID=1547283 RepID=UPI0009325A24|nr:hypothetical protein [Bacillus weihaiensis]